ncbi:hypothetical protein HK098_006834 [Nowakowskiella sp. JEL0407]|nr:hypothetical protein HK098_006834 [Nowakowskiella sp. JEL0407]
MREISKMISDLFSKRLKEILQQKNVTVIDESDMIDEGEDGEMGGGLKIDEGERESDSNNQSAVGDEVLDLLAEECKKLGAIEAHTLSVDFSERSSVPAMMEAVGTKLNGTIDVLFLNHITGDPPQFVVTMTDANIDKWLQGSTVIMTQLVRDCLPYLVKSKGRLVFSSSTSMYLPLPGLSLYRASKAMFTAFLDSLEQELILLKTDVSITHCVIGAVKTDALVLAEQNLKFNLDAHPAEVEDTAKYMVDCALYRRGKVTGPQPGLWIARWVSIFFPGLAGFAGRYVCTPIDQIFVNAKAALEM